MGNDKVLQTTESKKSFSPETIETVKRSIFRNSTDDELRLFIHKCLTVGVHPLDGLLTPIKFNTRDGAVVSFISSIDLFRSKAEDSGKYDGQDEPVYKYEEDDEDGTPKKCTVKVWKKDISRPFVGVAHMKEFLPDKESKRIFWNRMPNVMLAKCAEAQAFRKAFPQELNKLYVEEEMHNAINKASGGSTKPEITQATTEKKATTSNSGTERQTPSQEEIDSSKLISEKQGYFLISQMKKTKVEEQSVLNYLKIPSVFYVTWEKSKKGCMEKLLKTIQEKPEFFKKFEATKEPEKKEEPKTVQSHEDFLKVLRETAFAAGCADDEAINKKLLVNFPKIETIDKIDAESQGIVLDYFNHLKENPEQA